MSSCGKNLNAWRPCWQLSPALKSLKTPVSFLTYMVKCGRRKRTSFFVGGEPIKPRLDCHGYRVSKSRPASRRPRSTTTERKYENCRSCRRCRITGPSSPSETTPKIRRIKFHPVEAPLYHIRIL